MLLTKKPNDIIWAFLKALLYATFVSSLSLNYVLIGVIYNAKHDPSWLHRVMYKGLPDIFIGVTEYVFIPSLLLFIVFNIHKYKK